MGGHCNRTLCEWGDFVPEERKPLLVAKAADYKLGSKLRAVPKSFLLCVELQIELSLKVAFAFGDTR